MEKEKLSSQMEKKPQKGIPETWTGVIPRHIEELITQLAQSGGMKPVEPIPIPEGCWLCFYCRTVNSRNFCTECGKKRPDDVN